MLERFKDQEGRPSDRFEESPDAHPETRAMGNEIDYRTDESQAVQRTGLGIVLNFFVHNFSL